MKVVSLTDSRERDAMIEKRKPLIVDLMCRGLYPLSRLGLGTRAALRAGQGTTERRL